MNRTREQAIEELRRMVLAALGELDAAVYLFGSHVRSEVRHASNIDVGEAIAERLKAHAAVLHRWLAALEQQAVAGD
jgi:predicted nucleotidyltransferase